MKLDRWLWGMALGSLGGCQSLGNLRDSTGGLADFVHRGHEPIYTSGNNYPDYTPDKGNYPADGVDKHGRPTTLRGWLPDYTLHLMDEVRKNGIVEVFDARGWGKFCPRAKQLSYEDRVRAAAEIFHAISFKECHYARNTSYVETTMEKGDRVTGKSRPLSEGLLQLSYQDQAHYCDRKNPRDAKSECRHQDNPCNFDFKADQRLFETTWSAWNEHGRRSSKGYPERNIYDPYRNLSCGIHVVKMQGGWKQLQDHSFERFLGNYWRVMKPDVSEHADVRMKFKEVMPACFQSVEVRPLVATPPPQTAPENGKPPEEHAKL